VSAFNQRTRRKTKQLCNTQEQFSERTGIAYEACLAPGAQLSPCETDSLDEFLLERYTAYTSRGATRRTFRVWHPPWPQMPMQVSVIDNSLLIKAWPWFQTAKFVGANYSPSLCGVWMGRSRFVK
jgi:uncharacterized protein